MFVKTKITALLLAFLMVTGCVTRKMIIRSNPPGAPVWVDERYAGETPVEIPFTYYGTRKVQVGPVRSSDVKTANTAEGEQAEKGNSADEEETAPRMTHKPVIQMVKLKAPLYDVFPIDFFTNVLLPLEIKHEVPLSFDLPSADMPGSGEGDAEARARAVMERATRFRSRALHPAPEELPPMD